MIVWQVVVERQVGAAVSGRTVYILDSAGVFIVVPGICRGQGCWCCTLQLYRPLWGSHLTLCFAAVVSRLPQRVPCARGDICTGRSGSRVQEFDARGRPVRDELQ